MAFRTSRRSRGGSELTGSNGRLARACSSRFKPCVFLPRRRLKILKRVNDFPPPLIAGEPYHIGGAWPSNFKLTHYPVQARRYGLTFPLRLAGPGDGGGVPSLRGAVPLSESVDATVAGERLAHFLLVQSSAPALSPTRACPQLEAIAGESCRVLRIPIAAVKQRPQRDSQLARTIDRVAHEDLARKLERMVFMAAGVAPKNWRRNQSLSGMARP